MINRGCYGVRQAPSPNHTPSIPLHPQAGTPLQNDLGELLALLRFLMPSLFGNSMDLNDEAILGAELEVASHDEQVQEDGYSVSCM